MFEEQVACFGRIVPAGYTVHFTEAADNCPLIFNPDQRDLDNDVQGML